MPKISASIVSYGGAQEVIAAVDSILAHAPQDFTLYLIDNRSPDKTPEILAQQNWDERVQLLCLEKNLGFGGGHNSVLEKLDSDYHFVINPDVVVDTDVMSALPAWMEEHPDVVMATPQLFYPHGERQDLPRRKPNAMALLARQVLARFPHNRLFGKINDHYIMADEDLTQVTEIQFCTGSFFCVRTAAYREMGGFDEDYFMYVEDADITQKALKYGRVCLVPQFRAVHAWHRNPMRDARHFAMQMESMLKYWRKWGFQLF